MYILLATNYMGYVFHELRFQTPIALLDATLLLWISLLLAYISGSNNVWLFHSSNDRGWPTILLWRICNILKNCCVCRCWRRMLDLKLTYKFNKIRERVRTIVPRVIFADFPNVSEGHFCTQRWTTTDRNKNAIFEVCWDAVHKNETNIGATDGIWSFCIKSLYYSLWGHMPTYKAVVETVIWIEKWILSST